MQSQDLETKLAGEAQYQKQLNRVGEVFGLQAPTVQILNAMTDSKTKAFWVQAAQDPNVMQGRYGYDVYSALDNLNRSGVVPPPGIAMVQQKLNQVVSDTITKAGLFTWKNLPVEVQHNQLENALKEYINTQSRNIPDSGGLFSAGSLSSVLSIPMVKQTELGKEMSGIAAANPEHPLSAQEVYATGALMIQQGRITPEQFANESTLMFQAAGIDANQKYNYQRLGFDGLNLSTGYRTDIKTGSGPTGATYNLNVMNSGAAYDTILKMILREQIGKVLLTGPEGIPFLEQPQNTQRRPAATSVIPTVTSGPR